MIRDSSPRRAWRSQGKLAPGFQAGGMLVAIGIDISGFKGDNIPLPSPDAANLIRACALSGSETAWCELVVRFRKPVGVAIIRVARNWGVVPQELLDDLVQETFLKLAADKCARLYAFAQEHPEAVDLYVKTIAANLARDYLKKDSSLKRGSGNIVQLLDTFEAKANLSSAGGVSAIEQDILLREIDECLETNLEGPTKARDRSIFWLHYRQGMTAGSIAEIPGLGLTVKGVESVLHRLTMLVRNLMVERYVSRADAPAAKGLGSAESF